jgi:tetratricopeptide (TPR) repeat protein
MADYLSIPLSAVKADWFNTHAIPELQKFFSDVLKDGGLLYLGVDSDDEGRLLLNRIKRLDMVIEWQCLELTVKWSDPYLVWEKLVGTPDELGLEPFNGQHTLVLLKGGCFFPYEFIKLRASSLTQYAKTHHLIILLPTLHTHLSKLEIVPADTVGKLEVLQLRDCPIKDREEMIKQLVQTSAPSLDDGMQDRLVNDLLEANPNSRTKLQQWINYYMGAEDCLQALNKNPPPLPSLGPPTIIPPTRNQLKAAFSVANDKLDEANALFEDWLGYPLIRQIEPLADPFESTDPIHWFSSVVSNLCCRLMDAANLAFKAITQYDIKDKELKTMERPPLFYETVRNLRTVMQHGLLIGDKHNFNTLKLVKSWYFNKIKTDYPERHHWRILTYYLIEEYDEAVSQLRKVIRFVPTSDSSILVRAAIKLHERNLEKHTWREILQNVMVELNADLDIELFLEKKLDKFRQQLKKSPVDSSVLREEAYQIVSTEVIEEISKCPVDGTDIKNMGIKGALIKKWLDYAQAEWKKSPNQTKEQLIELVKSQYSEDIKS